MKLNIFTFHQNARAKVKQDCRLLLWFVCYGMNKCVIRFCAILHSDFECDNESV